MERHVRSSATKTKTKVAIENPKLDNAGRLRGVYFIDPADAEFKETIQNARRKLEFPMPAAMSCKTKGGKYRETCGTSDALKTKYACVVEADESTRKRLEGTLHKDHEDHVGGKGINSLNHYNLVHKFIPMPQAMNIPDAKKNDRVRRLAAAGTNQDLSFQESARTFAAENSEIIVDDDSEWPNNFHISRAYVPHREKVFSNLRQQLKRNPKDNMENLDVNTLTWRTFMTVTVQAAVHLGNDY